MTKSEFIERIASDDRIGSKKDAADAVEAVLDTIMASLKGGEDVNFTGFGKFSVNERGHISEPFKQRRDRNEHFISAAKMRAHARPCPAVRSLHQPRPNRIERHGARRVHQVLLVQHHGGNAPLE